MRPVESWKQPWGRGQRAEGAAVRKEGQGSRKMAGAGTEGHLEGKWVRGSVTGAQVREFKGRGIYIRSYPVCCTP